MKKFKSTPRKIKNINPIKMKFRNFNGFKIKYNLFDTYPYANIQ